MYSMALCAHHWMSGYSHPQYHHHYCICEAAPATAPEHVLDHPLSDRRSVGRGSLWTGIYRREEDIMWQVEISFSHLSDFTVSVYLSNESRSYFTWTAARHLSPNTTPSSQQLALRSDHLRDVVYFRGVILHSSCTTPTVHTES